MKNQKLLIPGPVDSTEGVTEEMGQPTVPHYGSGFVEVYNDLLVDLRRVFGSEKDPFLFVGPGSGALDMCLGSLLTPGEKVLVPRNGFFGERLAQIAKASGLEVHAPTIPIGEPIRPADVDAALESDNFQALAIVHHETSTGVLNPLKAISQVAQERGVPIVVDAVSSLGGVPLSVDEWGIDLCVTVSNKCLGAPPGLAPLSVSDRAWEVIEGKDTSHGWYQSLETWQWYRDNWTGWHPYPTTVCSNLVFALRRSVQEILEEGLNACHAQCERAAGRTRRGLQDLGFEMFIPAKYASPLTTAVRARPDFAVGKMAHFLREEHGLAISGGIEELSGKIFRIGHMGLAASDEYVDALLAGVENFLQREDLI